ncbi:hypothetical protein FH508_0012450 [Lysinibacillus sp. CD3-6]|uniref:hypothetical protein n=1 Tax=Lysinibacillus sp. CD3-6 TaxID=2892541 RepID=UPI001174C32B|nr:hypothetical protein [Lysinibacillus sp. CD3-6]UED78278.1 hypothetical protein FH508_0012450 [Lysinibacillus sp. CD3-6]
MAIKVQEYLLLQEFKREGAERAAKLLQFQKDAESARSRLRELQTQYEQTFTESVKHGTDATAQLVKIDDDIALQKEVVTRRERDLTLAHQAMPETIISSVEVIEKYKPEYADGVRAELEDKVNPKLQLARDLILSCIDDHKEYSSAYNDIYREITDLVTANHQAGKTRYIMTQIHPTDSAQVFGATGTISGVRKLLEQVSQYTFGNKPRDYKYIDVVPTTTEKVGK